MLIPVPQGCDTLANSPNPGFEKGCRGAVNLNGYPNHGYCTNTGNSRDRFKWFKDCCKWENDDCIPKESEEGNNLMLQMQSLMDLPIARYKRRNL